MTPSEAQKLLTTASGFDNRDTTSEAAPVAWAAALADVPCDADAFAAVHRYYGQPDAPGAPTTGRRWIEPHHVRSIRRTIRAERLGDTIPAYPAPDPDETGSEFVRRRRAQLEAIGDGREQPVPVRQLTGAPAPAVADALARIGRPIPAQPPADFRERAGLAPRNADLNEPCPTCKARSRMPCTTPKGRTRETIHAARAATA